MSGARCGHTRNLRELCTTWCVSVICSFAATRRSHAEGRGREVKEGRKAGREGGDLHRLNDEARNALTRAHGSSPCHHASGRDSQLSFDVPMQDKPSEH